MYRMMSRGWTNLRWCAGAALSVLLPVVSATVGAAEPSVVFDVQPRVLAVGEAAQATITLQNMPHAPPPSLPPIDGFEVQAAGVETRIEMNEAGMNRSHVHKFLLHALKAGEHTIGPFRYEAGGRVWDLPAIRLSVVPAQAAAGGATEARAMARLRLSKSSVYIHERFTVEIDLLFRGVELDRQVELDNMPAGGLKLGPFVELPARREVVEGEVFEVRTFRTEARALNSGELLLQPQLRTQVIVRRSRRSRDWPFGPNLLDDFFAGTPFDRAERRVVTLAAAPVTLVVRPLPAEGRPESFSGAVGACSWDVDVRPTELTAGEPVTITMTIRGDANLETVQAPALRLGPEFRVYEPRLVPRPGRDERERVFEQIVIPRDETVREIPPLPFSYFDPEMGSYRELVRGPFPLVVRPATNGAGPVRIAPGVIASGSQVVSDTAEIEYLKPVPVRPRRARNRSPAQVAVLLATPPLLAGAVVGWVRRRERIASDLALARRMQAPRVAREAVRRMRETLASTDARPFYDAMWSALTGYFGHRLNLPPGEVDADRVLAAFGPSIEEPVRRAIGELFAQCAAVRFGGGETAGAERRTQLDRLLEVLHRCERVRR